MVGAGAVLFFNHHLLFGNRFMFFDDKTPFSGSSTTST
jgi:hypothetical protein